MLGGDWPQKAQKTRKLMLGLFNHRERKDHKDAFALCYLSFCLYNNALLLHVNGINNALFFLEE